MSGTLNEQLQQIAETKSAIADAINSKGVSIESNDAFSTYANKIRQIQGEGGSGTLSAFNAFDLKVTDRLLNDVESIGWTRTGKVVKKVDNPDFYERCLQEYKNSIIQRQYRSSNVTIIGDLKDYKGLLSGFVSNKSGAKVIKTVPSTVTSFEMVAKIFVSEDHTTYKAIYCQPVTTNYITPQLEVGTAGKVQVAVSKSGSSWDYNIQDTEQCLGQTLWVKSTLKDGVLSLLKSFDGKDYKLIGTVDNVQSCKWTTGIGVGVDSDTATHALDGGTIDLMECYIDINGERWWTGCETFNAMRNENGHKYVTPDEQNYIDEYYKKFGYSDYYIIDETLEQITLPSLIEPECTYVYFCTGTQVTQDIIIDLSKEIELNNPFFLGQSQYFENEPNNLSWLKSDGSYHSKEMYPSMFEYIKENIEKGTNDFKLITEEYDDYCYILDQENNQFRLPLLNGSEDRMDNGEILTNVLPSTLVGGNSYTFIAPCNGSLKLSNTSSSGLIYMTLQSKDGIGQGITVNNGKIAGGTANTSLFMLRGQKCNIDVTGTGNTTLSSSLFVKTVGNGSLYYFVGESIQNANIINAGKIQTELANKLDITSIRYDKETSTLYIGAI